PGSRWTAGSQLVLANHHFRNRLSRQLAGQQCASRQRDRNDFASESISSRICPTRSDQFPFRGAPSFSRFLLEGGVSFETRIYSAVRPKRVPRSSPVLP